jgi:hypothetical protein
MQWKYDFYLGLRQYVEETWNQADIEANTHAPRSKHQAEEPNLPRQDLGGQFEGLRLLARQHGGALARRLLRRRSHAAPSGSA